jgi:hypothetical protein
MDLDGTEVHVIYVGPCHQVGDTIIHVPKEGVVFAGDVLFRQCTPMGWLTSSLSGSEGLNMQTFSRFTVRLLPVAVALLLGPAARAQQAAAPAQETAKTWPGRTAELEEYLRTAKVVKLEGVSVGVTKPRRAYLEPGGPADSIVWKPIRPGFYGGFFESYRSEIATYEIDKLLGLEMVPPTVEKRVDGVLGAAIMWAAPTKSFKEMGATGAPTPPPMYIAKFNQALVRAKMFDNLIGNIDPNLGNWLVDPSWNLILIDHSRALTSTTSLVHKMTHIDRELWAKMQALTEEQLKAAVGGWLGDREIRALLERRKKLGEEIDRLVKASGPDAVFLK